MPVGEMLRRMDSKELTEWRAYFKVEKERTEEASKQQPPLEQNITATMKGYGK